MSEGQSKPRPRREVPPTTAEADRPDPSIFALPTTVVSHGRWTRTDLHFKGRHSSGYWAKDDEGRLAVWKPGLKRPHGSTEAFREFVCSVTAEWLGVNVPLILLQEHPDLGPCSVCPHVVGTALQYVDIMLLPTFPDLRTSAKTALVDYIGRTIVLDVLVGAEDRGNDRNHIFVEETREWHSLDYGLSFNAGEAERGVGDPGQPYVYNYLSDIRDAARLCRSVISATIKMAAHIPPTRFEELVRLPPQPFASAQERRETAAFLVNRQSRLEEIVEQWWFVLGLPGAKQ